MSGEGVKAQELTASQSQPCGEASADAEVFAGLTAEPSAAFTPGPWFAGPLQSEDPETGAPGDVSIGPYDLAERYGKREDYSPERFDDHYEDAIAHVHGCNHDAEANANLVAAAPDYAAAAAQMLAHEDGGGDGWWRGFEMLKAAHAKALRAAPARLPDSPSVSQDEPDYKSLFLSVREALEPFARHAERYPEGYPDSYVPTNFTTGPWGESKITLGHFRRASTALSVGGGGGISSVADSECDGPRAASESQRKSEGETR